MLSTHSKRRTFLTQKQNHGVSFWIMNLIQRPIEFLILSLGAFTYLVISFLMKVLWAMASLQIPNYHCIFGFQQTCCAWISKAKLGPQGNLEKLKARVVAEGNEQTTSINFLETFAPIVCWITI